MGFKAQDTAAEERLPLIQEQHERENQFQLDLEIAEEKAACKIGDLKRRLEAQFEANEINKADLEERLKTQADEDAKAIESIRRAHKEEYKAYGPDWYEGLSEAVGSVPLTTPIMHGMSSIFNFSSQLSMRNP